MIEQYNTLVVAAQSAKNTVIQAANDAVGAVIIRGREIMVTNANRRFVEAVLANDAARAYEDAVFSQPGMRMAIAI